METQLLKSSVRLFSVCCGVVVYVFCCCSLQDMMAALNSELQCSQGTVGELKSAINDVSPFPSALFSLLVLSPAPHLSAFLPPPQLVTENQALVEKNLSLKELHCQVCP